MEVAEGVENAGSSSVCLLLKSIYSLKQSANLWNEITSTLRTCGFEPSTAEPSIFIDKRGVIIALYIDDLLILVKKESAMRDIGQVSKVLGIHVSRDTSGIKINQGHYIHQILMELGMEKAK